MVTVAMMSDAMLFVRDFDDGDDDVAADFAINPMVATM